MTSTAGKKMRYQWGRILFSGFHHVSLCYKEPGTLSDVIWQGRTEEYLVLFYSAQFMIQKGHKEYM